MMKRDAVCGSVMQCVAVRDSMRQCVAVCCSVLQCVVFQTSRLRLVPVLAHLIELQLAPLCAAV